MPVRRGRARWGSYSKSGGTTISSFCTAIVTVSVKKEKNHKTLHNTMTKVRICRNGFYWLYSLIALKTKAGLLFHETKMK